MDENLSDWEFVLNVGANSALYKKGTKRIVVNRGSGEVIMEYEVSSGQGIEGGKQMKDLEVSDDV